MTVGTGGTGAIASPTAVSLATECLAVAGVATVAAGATAVAVGEAGESVVEFSKGHQGNQRDTGLRNTSDEEIEKRIKDPNTSSKEKRRLQKEQKARGIRNINKRSGYNRRK